MCNMAGRETTLHMEYLPPIPLSKKYEFSFKKDSLAFFSLAVITKKLFLESFLSSLSSQFLASSKPSKVSVVVSDLEEIKNTVS